MKIKLFLLAILANVGVDCHTWHNKTNDKVINIGNWCGAWRPAWDSWGAANSTIFASNVLGQGESVEVNCQAGVMAQSPILVVKNKDGELKCYNNKTYWGTDNADLHLKKDAQGYYYQKDNKGEKYRFNNEDTNCLHDISNAYYVQHNGLLPLSIDFQKLLKDNVNDYGNGNYTINLRWIKGGDKDVFDNGECLECILNNSARDVYNKVCNNICPKRLDHVSQLQLKTLGSWTPGFVKVQVNQKCVNCIASNTLKDIEYGVCNSACNSKTDCISCLERTDGECPEVCSQEIIN